MAQMVYFTIRTTRSVLEKLLNVRMDGESIRFWKESSGGWWSSNSYHLWRVYAATFSGSKATIRLSKSTTYRQISKEELENEVALPTAQKYWEKININGSTNTPTLIIMAGTPLSGKTTLAKEIVHRVNEPTVLVENDIIRELIVSEMDLASPKYSIAEHRTTYNVSWELVRLALSHGCHVIFDATNRTEEGRAGAYQAAREYDAQILVIFMKASSDILLERYLANPEKQKAFDKLGSQKYNPKKCSVPYILVESDKTADLLLNEIIDSLVIPIKP